MLSALKKKTFGVFGNRKRPEKLYTQVERAT